MLDKQKYHTRNEFMGVPVKCEPSYPSFTKILEALYVMIYEGTKVYSRPRGYHVRLRFTKEMTSRTFSARLSTFYKRKSGYTPLRLTVVEVDEDERGLHHHFSIILNDRLDRKASLQRFMLDLFTGGFLSDYKVIAPNSDHYGQHIQTLEEKDNYFEWMSYLAKVATKPVTGQVWSTCRAVSRLLNEWKLTGNPDLRKHFIDFNQKNESLSMDTFADTEILDASINTINAPQSLPLLLYATFLGWAMGLYWLSIVASLWLLWRLLHQGRLESRIRPLSLLSWHKLYSSFGGVLRRTRIQLWEVAHQQITADCHTGFLDQFFVSTTETTIAPSMQA